MRWPIRVQIMLPMLLLMLVSLAGVSALNAYLSYQQAKRQIIRQLSEVAATLADSSFPLSDAVLEQMRGLSGAEFVLSDADGAVVATSSMAAALRDLPRQNKVDPTHDFKLGTPTQVGDTRFYLAAVRLRRRAGVDGPLVLHILFPERSYIEALRQAVLPPLIVGGVALLLVVILGAMIAWRVTHPLRQLGGHVDRIAQGDFRDVPLPRRDDEVKDLADSINTMARMLAQYEDNVRRNEQLRTIGQLGAGMAHQMRNAATGCRMALDIHRMECPDGDKTESLDVATRQLALMEKYLQRFLSLGRRSTGPPEELDVSELVAHVIPLVRPVAQHVGVRLDWTPPAEPFRVRGNEEDLEQVIVNLLLNAVEAVSQHGGPNAGGDVAISVRGEQGGERRAAGDRVTIEVQDSGPGPAVEVQQQIFEPLITEKPDGTGLGLFVAKEIVEQHDGSISWHCRDGRTCFVVSLPSLQPETASVEAISR